MRKVIKLALFLIAIFSSQIFQANAINVGKGTYGNPDVYNHVPGLEVNIGNYCSISTGVLILLGVEHRPDWVTTYPFNVLWPEAGDFTGHPASKGNVNIGSDVWIAMNVTILSGVNVGHGAVLGCGAVVSKDVPPYAIVAGNPARVVKYRFDPETIDKLLDIAWWDWPEDQILAAMPFLLSDDIQLFLQYCGK